MIYPVLCMKLVIFYSIRTISYTKYFVHSYTVDVVFILSYEVNFKKQYFIGSNNVHIYEFVTEQTIKMLVIS